MKTPDLLDLATRNLRESILRNSLTTIGISVGVASLVSMMSLGIGLQRMISVRLERVGFDLLTVMNRANNPMAGGGGDLSQSNPADERALDEAARLEIEKLPGVVEAYPQIRFPGEFAFGDLTRRAISTGLPDSVKTTDDFNNVKGRFFSSQQAAEAMIDKTFAAELLGKNVARPGRGILKKALAQTAALDAGALAKEILGKDLVLNYTERLAGNDQAGGYSVLPRQTTLKVVGVLDIDMQSRYFRMGVFLPLKFAQGLRVMQFTDPRVTTPVYNNLIVRVKDSAHVQAVEDTVKKMGFGAFSIQDAMRSLRQGFAVFDMFLGVFGSLALAVASIGIVNTLVMAILERRREIGIMKAIGASDSDVKRVFFAEAGAMGVLGGVVGVLLGWLIGRAISFGTNIYLTRQGAPNVEVWYVSWWLVGGAIGFAVVVSLLAGWYPASRASRLDPVEALRYQ